jgi:hypothetical protein
VRLVKSERNVIFECIGRARLNPNDFEWAGNDSEPVLIHSGSQSEFGFVDKPAPRRLKFRKVVGDGPTTEGTTDTWVGDVEGWLEEVKRDLESPDLFAALREQQELLLATEDAAGTDENTLFTPDEQRKLASVLQAVRADAQATYSADEMREFDSRLSYLEGAATRVPRFDWRNLCMGTFLNAIATSVLPPATTLRILSTALQAIAHLSGHGPGLPPGY